jgi:small subunit ribosomal protein S16
MAVRIRLTRTGKKKQPTYRVVVADGRAPRDGRYIEQIGRYDPRPDPSVVEIDQERAAYWLEHGAQPSDPVRRLLQIVGVVAAPAAAAPTAAKVEDARIHVVGEKAQMEAAAEEASEQAAAEEASEQAADTGASEASEASEEEQ